MPDIFSTKHVNDTMNDKIADAIQIANRDQILQAIPSRDSLRYVRDDTYAGDMTAILGSVYYETTTSNKLHKSYKSVSAEIDQKSILSVPQLKSELVIDSKVAAGIEALSFFSAQASANDVLEIRVLDNATARLVVKGKAWDDAVTSWLEHSFTQELINNPQVGTISIVTGVVQKYLTSKKYQKFDASAKGGGWGVNVQGSLYTSTSQFEFIVIYGLDLVTFKQVDSVKAFTEQMAAGRGTIEPHQVAAFHQKFDLMAKEQLSILSSFAIPTLFNVE
jgi:hypothetical protein